MPEVKSERALTATLAVAGAKSGAAVPEIKRIAEHSRRGRRGPATWHPRQPTAQERSGGVTHVVVNLALLILMADGMTKKPYRADVYHRENCIAPDIVLIVWTTVNVT